MKLFTHGRYATVASTLALVVAATGTSYAAVKITGQDIQDGTVTTKDIANETLKVKDLSAGARASLRGSAGPTGPAGLPRAGRSAWRARRDGTRRSVPRRRRVQGLPTTP